MSAQALLVKHPTRLFLLLLLFGVFGSRPCPAALPEVQIKSAYVFNFIKFVVWPAAETKPGKNKLRLCVIGSSELYASLSVLDGQRVGEYRLDVVRPGGDDRLRACHVLYIGELEQKRLVAIIKSLGNAPVLTISDIPGFAERGGGIGLLNRNDRMLFEVNLAATRKAGLQLSGQMLNLAANIFGK
ncbi:MAG: YfiR family protein [Nitrosomonadales bacterium]|nr:YfiR family protein [Nitrosomonadales bacterium]